MATRFLIIVGETAERTRMLATQVTDTTTLTRVTFSDRCAVFMSEDGAYVRATANDVIVMGHLFSRERRPKRVRSLDDRTAEAIRVTHGDHLTRYFWGGYVSFIHDTKGNQVFIQRDPSGQMPCVYQSLPDATVIASDVETLHEAGLLHVDIDWDFLDLYQTAIDFPTARTGLAGVTELLAGFRLEIGNRLTTVPAWSPWDYTAPRSAPDRAMPEQLYDTVQSTIQAWGNGFQRGLIGVSGGLDSSIVAAGLSSSQCEVTGLTMATHEAGGDERPYARILAQHLGMSLNEAFHCLHDIDLSQTTAAHLPRPGGGAFAQSHTKTQLALAQNHGTDAFFGGVGGDNVFCFMQSATPFLDRALTHGPGLGAWRTLLDICKLTDASVWDVLAMAKQKYRQGNRYIWPLGKRKFLHPRNPDPAWLQHPWLDAPKGALPGKAVHIAMLARVQATLDSFSRMTLPPQIHPLLSQPIVELCLQIPTWAWCADGQNRSVARQAYNQVLPKPLVQRRSKGSPNTFAFDVLQANRGLIGEMLKGGLLDRAGLLDMATLETCLNPSSPLVAPDHVYLSALLETEAWARHWQAKSRVPYRNQLRA